MAKKIKVAVLGKTGMLGLMVNCYFASNTSYEVIGTERSKKKGTVFFDSLDFLKNEKKYKFLKKADYIINCIGVIKPYCKDNDPEGVVRAIQVNAYFPHVLAKFLENSKTKMIQIATDCVYSGKIGNYDEKAVHDPTDVYGKTKSLGEVQANHLLNIRCSIIGPEQKNKLSLLEWFLTQKEGTELTGFVNHEWNGITTLQFAKICHKIIIKNIFIKLRKKSSIHHFTPNTTVSKYELLKIFKDVFEKKVKIQKGTAMVAINRTIKSQYNLLNQTYPKTKMKDALHELCIYMRKNNLFF